MKNEKKINNNERKKYASIASLTGIILNLILFGSKLAIGYFALSVAIIADAFNNLADSGSSLLTWIGFKLSEKTSDKSHPLGHGRAEYLTGFIIDFLIILVGIDLFKDSIDKIINPVSTKADILTFIFLSAGILIKFFLFLFYKHISIKINSSAIKASAIDSLSDCFATLLVLISVIVGKYCNIYIDGWAGIGISIFIIFSGAKECKDTIDLLLGSNPDPQFIKDIYNFSKKYPEILGIHDIMVHDYGPGRKFISFHAEISSDSNINYAHDIIDCMERDMNNEFGCIVTIHCDPISINDELTCKLYETTKKAVNEIDSSFSIHDFRITNNGKHIKLIFDLLIPFESKWTIEDAKKCIEIKIKAQNPNYYPIINAERPYI